MRAEIGWLDDPEVFRVNQLPAHSDHRYYGSYEEYQKSESSLEQSLDGLWKFCFSRNAAQRPKEFYREDFDASGFQEIKVPGHIELAGFDKIHYINTMYPWEGQEFRRPAGCGISGSEAKGMFSEAEYNPVGSYLCRFDLQEGMKGKDVALCLEGVEQAVYVWLNGVFIGYAEDSFTPSEFDLSEQLRQKDNVLALEVHKRSTAAFLEDQDFFRFFGIFRSVKLYAKPEIHVEDLWIRPQYEKDGGSGFVELQVKFWKERPAERICAVVKDKERIVGKLAADRNALAAEEKGLRIEIPEKVRLWDYKSPSLYTLELEVYGKDGALTEIIPYKFGFRKIELRDKVMYLNGRRLILNGVNRHEWSAATGRCITEAEERWDLACMKRNRINAVRTCHYPDRISWYYLCDEGGIYVMAETNLESHGSWQKLGQVEPSWNVPGSLPMWEEAVLDRARTNFEVFKNHTSVLFWSLGNESYAGDALARMNAFFKEKDPDRLVHYEGVFHREAYKDRISDMESRMYATAEDAEAYLKNTPDKPFILCEYMHDMGNSLGGMDSYIRLLDKYEMYQGGFIWDYIDQALLVTDEVTGRQALRYGGDFDDRPSDYEFSGNGIVFADRTEKPAMQEVRYYYGLHE